MIFHCSLSVCSGAGVFPALSAHMPLDQALTSRTQIRCPGMALIVLHLALIDGNQKGEGQLDPSENTYCTVGWARACCVHRHEINNADSVYAHAARLPCLRKSFKHTYSNATCYDFSSF